MENISKEKIEEFKKNANDKIVEIDGKLSDLVKQENKIASLRSGLYVEKFKTEGEVKALSKLLNLMNPPKEEKKDEQEEKL